jgi:hypothetical protein
MGNRMTVPMHIRWLIPIAGIVLASAEAKEPKEALLEVAVRWNPAQGGPKTAVATWAALGLAPGEQEEFEVRYFEIIKGPPVPENFSAIGRERQRLGDHRFELTYKMRGESQLPASPTLANWTCPVGGTDDRKDEADVSFVGGGNRRDAQSRSCTVESFTKPPAIPNALEVRLNNCSSKTVRLKRSDKKVDTKVEEWHLPTGETLIEVSWSGKRSLIEADDFERRVVGTLTAGKDQIRPLVDSKTALGSACKK